MELVRELREFDANATDASNDQSTFVLTIFENQRNGNKIFSRNRKSLISDGELQGSKS